MPDLSLSNDLVKPALPCPVLLSSVLLLQLPPLPLRCLLPLGELRLLPGIASAGIFFFNLHFESYAVAKNLIPVDIAGEASPELSTFCAAAPRGEVAGLTTGWMPAGRSEPVINC
jgi:hypothetical protein